MGAGAVAGTRVGVGVAHMRDGSDQPPRRAAFAAKRTRSRSRVRAPQVCPPDGGLCITQRSIQCNGIRADMVKMQPSFAEVADRIFTILHGAAQRTSRARPRYSYRVSDWTGKMRPNPRFARALPRFHGCAKAH